VLWQTLLGISALGLLSMLMMKKVPIQTIADEWYGLNEQLKEKSIEESNIA